jgi:hypothetical protein
MWDTRDRNISLWQHTAACELWCSDCIHSAFTQQELQTHVDDVTPSPVYSWDDCDYSRSGCCGKCGEFLFSESERIAEEQQIDRESRQS